MNYASGDRYTGGFRDGVAEGMGTHVSKSGDRYEGNWKADVRSGQGLYVWASGDRWEGEFANGQRILGQGTLTEKGR